MPSTKDTREQKLQKTEKYVKKHKELPPRNSSLGHFWRGLKAVHNRTKKGDPLSQDHIKRLEIFKDENGKQIWFWNKREEKREQNIQEIEEYMIKHKELPPKNSSLGDRCRTLRRIYNDTTHGIPISLEHQKRLETPQDENGKQIWFWKRDYEEEREQNIQEIEEYIRKHKELPPNKTPLGQRCTRLRGGYNQTIEDCTPPSPDHIKRLEIFKDENGKQIWFWKRDYEEEREQNIQEIEEYIRKHKELPPWDSPLGNTCKRLRGIYNETEPGTPLSQDHIKRLEIFKDENGKQIWLWNHEEKREQKIQEIEEYIRKYKKLPPWDSPLGNVCGRLRGIYNETARGNPLSQDHIERLEIFKDENGERIWFWESDCWSQEEIQEAIKKWYPNLKYLPAICLYLIYMQGGKFSNGEKQIVKGILDATTNAIEDKRQVAFRKTVGQNINEAKALQDFKQQFTCADDKLVLEYLEEYIVITAWNAIAKSKSYNERKKVIKKYRTVKGIDSINEFLKEYKEVEKLKPPEGFKNFNEKTGKQENPDIIQKLCAYRLLKRVCYGNWAEAGTGKTLCAILASRLIPNAKATLWIGNNSTVKNGEEGQIGKAILKAYPKGSKIIYIEDMAATKNIPAQVRKANRAREHAYILLNYEKFQQGEATKILQEKLLECSFIDFIVLDEIQMIKNRVQQGDYENGLAETEKLRVSEEQKASKRRENIYKLVLAIKQQQKEKHPRKNTHITAMTATAFVNNLTETISLLDLLNTGKGTVDQIDLYEHKHMGGQRNRNTIHMALNMKGFRYVPILTNPSGKIIVRPEINKVDVEVGNIRCKKTEPLQWANRTTRKKIRAAIRKEGWIRPGTMIYIHHVGGGEIIKMIKEELKKFEKTKDFTVGYYTGLPGTTKGCKPDKNSVTCDQESYRSLRDQHLDEFINGDLDILIGSNPIATGVDYIQLICNNTIILEPPWTYKDCLQLVGRTFRRRQKKSEIEVHALNATCNGKKTLDHARWELIEEKKINHEFLHDGIIPEKFLKYADEEHAEEGSEDWSKRIKKEKVCSSSPKKADKKDQVKAIKEQKVENKRAARKPNSIDLVNRKGRGCSTETLLKKAKKDPKTYQDYLKNNGEREMKKMNAGNPNVHVAEKIRGTKKRGSIAEFGSGSHAPIQHLLKPRKVLSYDALLDKTKGNLIKSDCRIPHRTRKANSFAFVAMVSALWGTRKDQQACFDEAYRCLKHGGMLLVAEPAQEWVKKGICTQGQLIKMIQDAGFEIQKNSRGKLVSKRGLYIYIDAIKK